MEDFTRERLARQDAIRSSLAQLQSTASALYDGLAAAADLRGIASLCHPIWKQLQDTDVFLRDLLVDAQWTPDARTSDPLQAIREYLAGAEAQVRGVMADEFEVDIARKRLSMAVALDETVLDLLDAYLQEAERQRQAQVNRGR